MGPWRPRIRVWPFRSLLPQDPDPTTLRSARAPGSTGTGISESDLGLPHALEERTKRPGIIVILERTVQNGVSHTVQSPE